MRLAFGDLSANFDTLPWKHTRVEGIGWIPLETEEGRAEGRARPGGAVLIRMEPGCGYTAHRHLGPEYVLVLQGGYQDEAGAYRSGETVRYPAGSSHAPRALDEPTAEGTPAPACVLYAVAPDGIELLEDEASSRSTSNEESVS